MAKYHKVNKKLNDRYEGIWEVSGSSRWKGNQSAIFKDKKNNFILTDLTNFEIHKLKHDSKSDMYSIWAFQDKRKKKRVYNGELSHDYNVIYWNDPIQDRNVDSWFRVKNINMTIKKYIEYCKLKAKSQKQLKSNPMINDPAIKSVVQYRPKKKNNNNNNNNNNSNNNDNSVDKYKQINEEKYLLNDDNLYMSPSPKPQHKQEPLSSPNLNLISKLDTIPRVSDKQDMSADDIKSHNERIQRILQNAPLCH